VAVGMGEVQAEVEMRVAGVTERTPGAASRRRS